MSVYELTRLHISGPITDATPACVILEVAHCMSLDVDWKQSTVAAYIEEVIRAINMVKVPTIQGAASSSAGGNETFPSEHHQFIATFVNADAEISWKLKPLIQAFRHLCQFYKVQIPLMPEANFIVGQKTPTTPLAYNACMLYRLCSYHNIRTSRTTTIEEMGQAIRNYNQDPEVLRERLFATIQSLSRSALISLSTAPELRVTVSPAIKPSKPQELPPMMHLNKEKKEEEVILGREMLPLPAEDSPRRRDDLLSSSPDTTVSKTVIPNIEPLSLTVERLSGAYTRLTDYRSILPRIEPICHEEAVLMAAIIYGVNLTECCNPYEEYIEMQAVAASGVNSYIPVYDKVFRERYLRNPTWFDIRRTWCSRLPRIYSAENLRQFAIAEGYLPSEFTSRNPEELMTLSRVTPTFYLGCHPDCTKKTTVIDQQDLSEINPLLLLTYGISEAGPYALYSVSELIAYFSESRAYTNPEKAAEMLPNAAVNKLRNIAQEKTRRSPRATAPLSEIEIQYKALLEMMDRLDAYAKATSAHAKKLAQYHADQKTRPDIEACLTNLLHMAYYMRGWKATPDHQDIPIQRSKTNFPIEAQGQVDFNVTAAIREFERSIGLLSQEVRTFFRTLPLMKAHTHGNDVSFQPTTNAGDGKTIFERIAIVKAGTSEASCIRLSSNLFAASAYYYIVACGMTIPFNPRHLAHVS